jgi:lipopolysaccharide transport system permease protein
MKKWDINISSKNSFFNLDITELWKYKDLIFMFVKRDVITIYKQTILGPIWFVIQPIMTMLIYIFVFGNIANISTDGLPHSLFYLSGIILWNYFSECFTQISETFTQNTEIFSKVYFPRLVIPFSKLFSSSIKLFIQFILFLIFFFYYKLSLDIIDPSIWILLTPYLIVLLSGLGLGFGLIFTSLTSKYRDLKFLLQFGIQLLMFSTPIIYPLSSLDGDLLFLMKLNPLSHIIESFKFSFLGKGFLSFNGIIYSSIFMILIVFLGVFIFTKTEKSFIDSI